MCHDTTEGGLGMAIIIHFSRFIHVHNPFFSPFIVVRDSPVVRAIGDKRVLGPGIVSVRTVWQESKRVSILVLGKTMGEAAVGELRALFAPELRWGRGCKEDTVLSG